MAGEFLQGSALALDRTAVEPLPGLVCRTSRRAVSESMGHIWEDQVKVDDFNCVFRAGKRSRCTLQVGRVSDTSIPLLWLKTVRGTECVSGLAHDQHF